MKFYVPLELTDPMVRDTERIPHGDQMPINFLALEVDLRRVCWLNSHPGWVYTGTALIKCDDGSPPPAYDVCLGFQRPRTPSEKEAQDRERTEYVAHKEADYARRAEEQKALLEQVLASLNP
jgi:hypothetical protein